MGMQPWIPYDLPLTVRQECFFANANNKAMFFRALVAHMARASIQVKQAAGDADKLIARAAIELSPTIDVVAVGTDADTLIVRAAI